MTKGRRWIYKNYWKLAILWTVVCGVLIAVLVEQSRASLFITSIGTALAFSYFVLQQKLAEAKMLKELFTEFNNRYNKLNDKLNSHSTECTGYPEVDNAIQDYFNLCAEEYFFHKEGCIPNEVWESWKNGMKHFFCNNEAVKRAWQNEMKNSSNKQSYYGFEEEVETFRKG